MPNGINEVKDKDQTGDISNDISEENYNTSYEKYQNLVRNRIACVIVLGVLIYQIIQARLEKSPTPGWFMPAMAALIIGTLGFLAWNIIKTREYHRAQAAERDETKKHV